MQDKPVWHIVKLSQHPIIISWFSSVRKLTLLQKHKAVWLQASHAEVRFKLVLLFKNQSDFYDFTVISMSKAISV